MKRILILSVSLALFFSGCGKSQEEIEKEKQKQIAEQQAKLEMARKSKELAEIKATEERVKYDLKDPESAKFRNVVKNCGEVNSKNSFGAYAGFGKFVINKTSNSVVFDSPDNEFFSMIMEVYCDKEYLKKYPISKQDGTNSVALDAVAEADFHRDRSK